MCDAEPTLEDRQVELVDVETDAKTVILYMQDAMASETEEDFRKHLASAIEYAAHVRTALDQLAAGRIPDIPRCEACGAAAAIGRTTCGSEKCFTNGDDQA